METRFAQHGWWMLNSTFVGIVFALVYLVLDPLFKAVYVLRFSSIVSRSTGDDLLAELKRLPPVRRGVGIAHSVVALFVLFSVSGAGAQESVDPVFPTDRVEQLDESIDRVMRDREFTWRMPRDAAVDESKEIGFFDQFTQWFEQLIETLGYIIGSIEDLLNKDGGTPKKGHSGSISPSLFTGLGIVFLVVLVAILGVAVFNYLKQRRMPKQEVREAQAVRVSVDLDDENVVATLLEEDEWIRMARELVSVGELRKAARAWFLAGIACLSRLDLLAVRTTKSNLDYRRELGRRARRHPELIPLFSENTVVFERAWYGFHAVSADDLERLELNVERFRRGPEA